MLTVHHLGISQSERIVWLCEELEIAYDLVLYDRDPVTRLAPARYKALHPLQTAPVITDGDVVLAESAAIIEYICRKHAGGRLMAQPDDAGFADFLFWFHFANGSLVSAGMSDLIAAMLGASVEQKQRVSTRSDNAHALVEARLGAAPYLAGEAFSAADIITVYALTTMRVFIPRDLAPYPNIRAYLARIAARPAYQRALAKSDPGLKPMID